MWVIASRTRGLGSCWYLKSLGTSCAMYGFSCSPASFAMDANLPGHRETISDRKQGKAATGLSLDRRRLRVQEQWTPTDQI